MNSKTLLLVLSVAAFSSCSTAYKSGQTPDDVYYSPVRVVEENNDDERKQEENKTTTQTSEEREIRWGIRDRRWRDRDDDYDYSYNKSPYGYCHCNCNNTGYYYNPYYSPWPVYSPKVTPINSTPRMINLGSYKGYNNAVNNNPKGGNGTNWVNPATKYNNSNRQSGLGRVVRQIFTPSNNTNNSNNSNTNNNTRTYTPSSSNTNSSSGSSNSSGSSVSRPARGGK